MAIKNMRDLKDIPKNAKKQFIIPGKPIQFTKVDEHTLRISFPCLPPSKNDWIRLHWASQQKRWFKRWSSWFLADYSWFVSGWRCPERVNVRIQLYFPDRHQRDKVNFICFPPLVDSLKLAKIIPDDNSSVCTVDVPEPIVNGTRRTVITIWSWV
jgi:hypothetical protein